MDLNLRHLDVPYLRKHWNSERNDSGFDEENKYKISSIPSPVNSDPNPDVTYRISAPLRFYPSKSKRLFVFGTSEFQNLDGYVSKDGMNDGFNNPDLIVVTPSNWSKIGFLNAGFEDSKVVVVPHGVNQTIYQPISQIRQKQFRDTLKVSDEEFLILSLGSMTYNKGIDVLVLAYAALKPKYPHIRLVLKDSNDLFGITVHDVLSNLNRQYPGVISENLYNSIIPISNNLTQSQLNGLYGAADCYASPYRAEGFNLTPLEAAASGTPVVITKGGSTDDYFHESFALQIVGK